MFHMLAAYSLADSTTIDTDALTTNGGTILQTAWRARVGGRRVTAYILTDQALTITPRTPTRDGTYTLHTQTITPAGAATWHIEEIAFEADDLAFRVANASGSGATVHLGLVIEGE